MTQTQALLLTLSVEVPVVAGLAATLRWAPRGLLPVAGGAALATLVTHPLLWIVDPLLAASLETGPRWTLLESVVVVVEAVILAGTTGLASRRALALSLAANAASFAVGVAIYSFG